MRHIGFENGIQLRTIILVDLAGIESIGCIQCIQINSDFSENKTMGTIKKQSEQIQTRINITKQSIK